jgi:predicted component of type VI protein secretion system
MAYLVIHTPHAPPQRAELSKTVVIGRAKGSGIWLNDTRVSRTHCQIEPRKGKWVLSDLGSGNGTYLNGKRLSKPVRLREDDELSVGETTITFHAGRMISDRPADPIEAAMSSIPPLDLDGTSDNSTIVGEPAPVIRPIPNLKPAKFQEPAVPLAFTRPPPTPIVRTESF